MNFMILALVVFAFYIAMLYIIRTSFYETKDRPDQCGCGLESTVSDMVLCNDETDCPLEETCVTLTSDVIETLTTPIKVCLNLSRAVKPQACLRNSDCNPGQSCSWPSGKCISTQKLNQNSILSVLYCTKDSDCGDTGLICVKNACVVPCTSKCICSSDGFCTTRCHTASDCSKGFACVDGLCEIP